MRKVITAVPSIMAPTIHGAAMITKVFPPVASDTAIQKLGWNPRDVTYKTERN